MFESFFQYISSANPYLIYFVLLVIPFIENVFPPSPSDLIVVICGTLIAQGTISFIPAVILASIGSEIGFLLLFYLGTQTDKKIIQAGKLKFISRETLQTAENWFNKYGFAIILFNRFISGIRSVIAFFAGVSELPIKRTVILSSISSVLWHVVLLGLGLFFGSNIARIDNVLNTYGNIVSGVVIVVCLFFIIRYFIKKKSSVQK